MKRWPAPVALLLGQLTAFGSAGYAVAHEGPTWAITLCVLVIYTLGAGQIVLAHRTAPAQP